MSRYFIKKADEEEPALIGLSVLDEQFIDEDGRE